MTYCAASLAFFFLGEKESTLRQAQELAQVHCKLGCSLRQATFPL